LNTYRTVQYVFDEQFGKPRLLSDQFAKNRPFHARNVKIPSTPRASTERPGGIGNGNPARDDKRARRPSGAIFNLSLSYNRLWRLMVFIQTKALCLTTDIVDLSQQRPTASVPPHKTRVVKRGRRSFFGHFGIVPGHP
jgi:hypothetical protein